jgi:hypothetical protein
MMDAFSYLSVLLSIILGLAITQVLQGYRALLLAKGRVRHSATVLIWSALILTFATQAWWASFSLRDHTQWNFLTVLIILAQMSLLYMVAALVFPDISPTGKIDLGVHFEQHRGAFFGFLLAMLGASILKSIALDGRLPAPTDLLFHIVLATIGLIGIFVSSARIQLAFACVSAGLFVAYVTVLFARLAT